MRGKRGLLAAVALPSLLAGCITWGERLTNGPAVTVENDTGSALVVSAPYVQFSVPAHSTRSITSYPDSVIGSGVVVTVFDAATCAIVGAQRLTFSDGILDRTLVVSAEGAISSRPWEQSDYREVTAPVLPAPSGCHADPSPRPAGSG